MKKRLGLSLALAVFLVYASFQGSLGWNQGARVGAIFSFVERGTPYTGTFRIDPYIEQTNPRGIWSWDWAQHDGKYFSNKAPGASFLGVPVYFVAFHLEKIFGFDPQARELTSFNAYLISLFGSALFVALASALLFLFLCEKEFRPRDAMLIGLVYAFGTLLFPFGISLFGHATTAALLLFAAVCLDKKLFASSGFFTGAALLTEYLAGISLVLMGAYLLWKQRKKAAAFALGAVPPVLLLLIYQKIAFGGFFVTAFAKTNPIFLGSASSTVGAFAHFSPLTLWHLLFSPYRGLFFFMPVLLAVFLRKRLDSFSCLCALQAVAYVGVISLFNAWHGGSSTGPRYLIPAIPFLCLLLPAYSQLKRAPRAIYAAAAVLSALHMWAISLVNSMVDPQEANPLFHVVYPALLSPGEQVRWHFLLFPQQPGVAAIVSFLLIAVCCAYLLKAARNPK